MRVLVTTLVPVFTAVSCQVEAYFFRTQNRFLSVPSQRPVIP
jgi:hypothetical protein